MKILIDKQDFDGKVVIALVEEGSTPSDIDYFVSLAERMDLIVMHEVDTYTVLTSKILAFDLLYNLTLNMDTITII